MSKGVKTIRVLQRARQLVANKDTWTRGSLARDKDGEVINVDNRFAVCFCLEGAVHRSLYEHSVNFTENGQGAEDVNRLHCALDILAQRVHVARRNCTIANHRRPLTTINDYLGREAALEVLDLAIAEISPCTHP